MTAARGAGDSPPWTRAERRALAAVLALSAALRLLALRWSLALPFVTNYPVVGARRAAGTLGGERLLDWSPLYAALATAIARAGLPARVALLGLQVGRASCREKV